MTLAGKLRSKVRSSKTEEIQDQESLQKDVLEVRKVIEGNLKELGEKIDSKISMTKPDPEFVSYLYDLAHEIKVITESIDVD